VRFASPDATVEAALTLMMQNGQPASLVGTAERLVGLVTLERARAAAAAGQASDAVGSFIETSAVHVHPDHPFDVVLERFAQSAGLLPVVSREQARRVEGVITLDDVAGFVERRRIERRDDIAAASR
jgi:CBS domain-containing protein